MYSKDYMRDEGRGSQRDEASGVGSEESEVRMGLRPIMITEQLTVSYSCRIVCGCNYGSELLLNCNNAKIKLRCGGTIASAGLHSFM